MAMNSLQTCHSGIKGGYNQTWTYGKQGLGYTRQAPHQISYTPSFSMRFLSNQYKLLLLPLKKFTKASILRLYSALPQGWLSSVFQATLQMTREREPRMQRSPPFCPWVFFDASESSEHWLLTPSQETPKVKEQSTVLCRVLQPQDQNRWIGSCRPGCQYYYTEALGLYFSSPSGHCSKPSRSPSPNPLAVGSAPCGKCVRHENAFQRTD